jgi:hypothetical protein
VKNIKSALLALILLILAVYAGMNANKLTENISLT